MAKYLVYGSRGAKYECDTLAEAKKVAGKYGVIEKVGGENLTGRAIATSRKGFNTPVRKNPLPFFGSRDFDKVRKLNSLQVLVRRKKDGMYYVVSEMLPEAAQQFGYDEVLVFPAYSDGEIADMAEIAGQRGVTLREYLPKFLRSGEEMLYSARERANRAANPARAAENEAKYRIVGTQGGVKTARTKRQAQSRAGRFGIIEKLGSAADGLAEKARERSRKAYGVPKKRR